MKIACDRCEKVSSRYDDWMHIKINNTISYCVCPDCEKLFWKFIAPKDYEVDK